MYLRTKLKASLIHVCYARERTPPHVENGQRIASL